MTLRLRPHHLLCVLTYVGKGYSAEFVANMNAVTARIADGEDVLIVAGPDSICAPLLARPDAHCRRQSVVERDRLAARDVSAVLGTPVEPGAVLTLHVQALAGLRRHFRNGAVRQGCRGCAWADLCITVAAANFEGARIKGNPVISNPA